jgi:hypothetical protein
MINKWLRLNPESGLDRQPLFWMAILTPLLVAIGFGIPIWLDCSFEFSEEAYTHFLNISKLPLAISAISIPLGVLVGRIHGTKQTSLQIAKTAHQIAKSQEQFELTYNEYRKKNYLDHYTHFKDFINNIDYQINIEGLYRHLFPVASLFNGDLAINEEFMNDLLKDLSRSIGLNKALRELVFELYDKKIFDLSNKALEEIEEYAFQTNLMWMVVTARLQIEHTGELLECEEFAKDLGADIKPVFMFLRSANHVHHCLKNVISQVALFLSVHHSMSYETSLKHIDTLIRQEESELIEFDLEYSGNIYGYS